MMMRAVRMSSVTCGGFCARIWRPVKSKCKEVRWHCVLRMRVAIGTCENGGLSPPFSVLTVVPAKAHKGCFFVIVCVNSFPT
jgi:hypothetical protein